MQHIKTAHFLWSALLRPGMLAVDATCGKGRDTAVLVATGADVIACDIQKEAVQATRQLIGGQAEIYQACHTTLSERLQGRVATALIYNLGYLPGGNKLITTQTNTTLVSLERMLPLIAPGGLISMMCYPGHPEGAREQKALVDWAHARHPPWRAVHHRFSDRLTAPSLLLIQRANTQ